MLLKERGHKFKYICTQMLVLRALTALTLSTGCHAQPRKEWFLFCFACLKVGFLWAALTVLELPL